ncbi:MAG: hypothetical protein ACM3KR_04680 [Deltaproteobacteria bacterium]
MSENISKKREKKKKNGNNIWILILVLTTIILSITMSSISSVITQNTNLITAIAIVISIIVIGIIFDIIGIAVAVADEKPFHAMASSKVKAAKYAIRLIRNADKVATFCNDVIGDVCGVISGSTSAFIVLKLAAVFNGADIFILGVAISAAVAGFTVLGKGLGKSYAISKSNSIVYKVALFEYHILRKFGILKKIFNRRKKCCK